MVLPSGADTSTEQQQRARTQEPALSKVKRVVSLVSGPFPVLLCHSALGLLGLLRCPCPSVFFLVARVPAPCGWDVESNFFSLSVDGHRPEYRSFQVHSQCRYSWSLCLPSTLSCCGLVALFFYCSYSRWDVSFQFLLSLLAARDWCDDCWEAHVGSRIRRSCTSSLLVGSEGREGMKVDNNKLQDCFVFPAAHSCERARGESGLIALYYDTPMWCSVFSEDQPDFTGVGESVAS